jgi:hypothetical protein
LQVFSKVNNISFSELIAIRTVESRSKKLFPSIPNAHTSPKTYIKDPLILLPLSWGRGKVLLVDHFFLILPDQLCYCEKYRGGTHKNKVIFSPGRRQEQKSCDSRDTKYTPRLSDHRVGRKAGLTDCLRPRHAWLLSPNEIHASIIAV